MTLTNREPRLNSCLRGIHLTALSGLNSFTRRADLVVPSLGVSEAVPVAFRHPLKSSKRSSDLTQTRSSLRLRTG